MVVQEENEKYVHTMLEEFKNIRSSVYKEIDKRTTLNANELEKKI